jgi:hypothetical protein
MSADMRQVGVALFPLIFNLFLSIFYPVTCPAINIEISAMELSGH